MSGVEAVGLIASVIQIIEATKRVYDAARDAQGQPEVFRQVAARLPLVIKILNSASVRAQVLDKTAQEELKPILESCKQKAENLKQISQKVAPKNDDKWYDRCEKFVGVLRTHRVERLMEGILKDIHVLACEKLMGTATDAEVKEIKEAMKEMKDTPSSLQDETGDALQQHHSGSGHNFGATGGAVQNIHHGTGHQYHHQIAGNASFGGKK